MAMRAAKRELVAGRLQLLTGNAMKSSIVLFALALLPFSASAQSNAELAARIAGLEARMAQLEGRGAAPDTSSLGPIDPKSQVFENWRKCKSGMTPEEVIELLGQPTSRMHSNAINNYPEMENLTYGHIIAGKPGGNVSFMRGRSTQCLAMNFPGS